MYRAVIFIIPAGWIPAMFHITRNVKNPLSVRAGGFRTVVMILLCSRRKLLALKCFGSRITGNPAEDYDVSHSVAADTIAAVYTTGYFTGRK